jgi:hypothetical protein
MSSKVELFEWFRMSAIFVSVSIPKVIIFTLSDVSKLIMIQSTFNDVSKLLIVTSDGLTKVESAFAVYSSQRERRYFATNIEGKLHRVKDFDYSTKVDERILKYFLVEQLEQHNRATFLKR